MVERQQVVDELRRPVDVEQEAPQLALGLRRRGDHLDDVTVAAETPLAQSCAMR